jgi:plastocyanin
MLKLHHASLTLVGAAALASAAAGQTTHDVQLFLQDFFPDQLSIQVGDTVRWTWVVGQHDVKSGSTQFCIPDGIFDSGPPVNSPGLTFEVTFDEAFLAANPVPNDVYEYFCSIHWAVGMTAVIEVDDALAPSYLPYGCGVNPAGSLSLLGGSATAGGSITLGVDNPLGTQPAGSLAFLAVATQPAAGFPCGLVLPGIGMPGPYGNGELLISIAAPNPLLVLGPQLWAGAGTPSPFVVGIPANPSFVGAHFFFQGVLAELTGLFAVTDAADVGIGS